MFKKLQSIKLYLKYRLLNIKLLHTTIKRGKFAITKTTFYLSLIFSPIIMSNHKILFILALSLNLTTIETNAQLHTHLNKQSDIEISHIDSGHTKGIVTHDIASLDTLPDFPGGINALYSYINSTRRYPIDAYQNKIQGRVLCSFIINSDGRISDIKVIKGITPSLDNEAMRIIAKMPRWNAGMINDTAVAVRYLLPIVFRI